MTRPPAVFDPEQIIGVLNRRDVRYVVIGGIAGGVQGAIWTTTDLDVCHARTSDDSDRLAAALHDLRAHPRDLPSEVAVTLDARALRLADNWTLETEFGELDCLATPAPGVDFDYLRRRARRFGGRSQEYLVADLEDLIVIERAAGRPQDRAHLEILEATLDERRRLEREAP